MHVRNTSLKSAMNFAKIFKSSLVDIFKSHLNLYILYSGCMVKYPVTYSRNIGGTTECTPLKCTKSLNRYWNLVDQHSKITKSASLRSFHLIPSALLSKVSHVNSTQLHWEKTWYTDGKIHSIRLVNLDETRKNPIFSFFQWPL